MRGFIGVRCHGVLILWSNDLINNNNNNNNNNIAEKSFRLNQKSECVDNASNIYRVNKIRWRVTKYLFRMPLKGREGEDRNRVIDRRI